MDFNKVVLFLNLREFLDFWIQSFIFNYFWIFLRFYICLNFSFHWIQEGLLFRRFSTSIYFFSSLLNQTSDELSIHVASQFSMKFSSSFHINISLCYFLRGCIFNFFYECYFGGYLFQPKILFIFLNNWEFILEIKILLKLFLLNRSSLNYWIRVSTFKIEKMSLVNL